MPSSRCWLWDPAAYNREGIVLGVMGSAGKGLEVSCAFELLQKEPRALASHI